MSTLSRPKPDLPPCPACGCPDRYAEKRFPKKLGLAIVAVAAVLSFWTYHLSLIAAALIDGLIYILVPQQLVCYRCRQPQREFPAPPQAPSFDHHIAELYNYGK